MQKTEHTNQSYLFHDKKNDAHRLGKRHVSFGETRRTVLGNDTSRFFGSAYALPVF
ncbi:MAG: hypothetical protein LBV47_08425 [Bacteroidales bacterium]|nr:hypothetical protein [Bacteroidales bacterium]